DTSVDIGVRCDSEHVQITISERERRFDWQELGPGDYLLRDGARQRRCVVAASGDDRWVWIDGRVHHLKAESGSKKRAQAPAGELIAPMPGQVVKVLVAAGDVVRKDQTLVVLEAMKMQYEIVAPRDGTVTRVQAAPGAQVAGGVTLVSLEESSPWSGATP